MVSRCFPRDSVYRKDIDFVPGRYCPRTDLSGPRTDLSTYSLQGTMMVDIVGRHCGGRH